MPKKVTPKCGLSEGSGKSSSTNGQVIQKSIQKDSKKFFFSREGVDSIQFFKELTQLMKKEIGGQNAQKVFIIQHAKYD